jgi:hypothetical protein
MKAQYWYWVAGAVALLMALLSGVAENRRSRRERLDDIGWVPWRGDSGRSRFRDAAHPVLRAQGGLIELPLDLTCYVCNMLRL